MLDRGKDIKWDGANLDPIDRLEVCLANKIFNHIDLCSREELLRIAKLLLDDCSEIRLFEKALNDPS